MAVTVSAAVLTGADPQAMSVVVRGVTAGLDVVVVGAVGADVWTIPGGNATSTGSQLLLKDVCAAVNTPVVYRATVDGVVYESAPVTVVSAENYWLQDLRGDIAVPFTWNDNGDPRQPESGASLTKIPGRARKVGRVSIGTDGGGSWELTTTKENSRLLHALVVASEPVVMRTNGQIRDIPAVDLGLMMSAPNRLFEGDGGVSTRRRWSIAYELQDHPEPYTALILSTVKDVRTYYTALTVAEIRTDFAVLTVADFAAFDFKRVRGA